jgi:hypothetical protein
MAESFLAQRGVPIAGDAIDGCHYVRTKIVFGPDGTANDITEASPLPVSIIGGEGSSGLTDAEMRATPVPVSGTFYQTTQPVSIASMPTTPVTGTFWPVTQPISGTVSVSGSVAVTGSFYQATQPVSIASMPSTPVTGTFWQATQPVSGTVTVGNVSLAVTGSFYQATQPISGTVTITPPTLTKAAQGATGLSVQDLKDAGRVIKVYSATFTGATTEALVTLVPITDGTAAAGATTHGVTSGKRLRLQSMSVSIKNAGAAGQGSVCNLRMTASGNVAANSPLVATCGAGTYLAIANVVGGNSVMMPDGLEMSGTMQFGVSQIGTATAGVTVTVVGYEY